MVSQQRRSRARTKRLPHTGAREVGAAAAGGAAPATCRADGAVWAGAPVSAKAAPPPPPIKAASTAATANGRRRTRRDGRPAPPLNPGPLSTVPYPIAAPPGNVAGTADAAKPADAASSADAPHPADAAAPPPRPPGRCSDPSPAAARRVSGQRPPVACRCQRSPVAAERARHRLGQPVLGRVGRRPGQQVRGGGTPGRVLSQAARDQRADLGRHQVELRRVMHPVHLRGRRSAPERPPSRGRERQHRPQAEDVA